MSYVTHVRGACQRRTSLRRRGKNTHAAIEQSLSVGVLLMLRSKSWATSTPSAKVGGGKTELSPQGALNDIALACITLLIIRVDPVEVVALGIYFRKSDLGGRHEEITIVWSSSRFHLEMFDRTIHVERENVIASAIALED